MYYSIKSPKRKYLCLVLYNIHVVYCVTCEYGATNRNINVI